MTDDERREYKRRHEYARRLRLMSDGDLHAMIRRAQAKLRMALVEALDRAADKEKP